MYIYTHYIVICIDIFMNVHTLGIGTSEQFPGDDVIQTVAGVRFLGPHLGTISLHIFPREPNELLRNTLENSLRKWKKSIEKWLQVLAPLMNIPTDLIMRHVPPMYS